MTVSKKPLAYSYVRMSTVDQALGDSKRRQVELSEAYAQKNNLELVADFNLHDIGVSAFKGANLAEGALGKFLEAIKAKKVVPGSYLLVESLDRLSRQEIPKSLSLFLEIVNSGIVLATLADDRTYTREKLDLQDLIISLVVMSRAHEESLTKSRRISAAWSNKRHRIGSEKLTARCPGWLKLASDRKSFEVIRERTTVVRRIFDESAAGIGNYSIARRLNKDEIPSFGRSRGWHISSVAKILDNRAVLGEFQPHQLKNGRRVPVGETVSKYYPRIITDELFYRAQAARNLRGSGGGGRRGERISNLFSGVARCIYCKSAMRFENKGVGPKGGKYLVCDRARRGIGCENKSWRYDKFEASFLSFVRELDLETIARDGDDAEKRASLDDEIRSLEGELVTLKDKRERTFELISQAEVATDFVAEKLNQLQQQIANAEVSLKAKMRERDDFRMESSRVYESKDQLKSLLSKIQNRESEKNYKLRAQVALRLRSIVTTLLIAVAGNEPSLRKTLDLLRSQQDVADHREELQPLLKRFEEQLLDERERRPYFVVGFHDGSIRGVYPSADDPLHFEEQVYRDEDAIWRLTWDRGNMVTDQLFHSGRTAQPPDS
jgi:DNA invertase Pin-like site-specific DNA recombinase